MPQPEIIVVGLGAAGAAALYQLSRRGVPALGLDRFAPPHDRGSSHGESRITRQAIGEGEHYVPLVLRAHAIWRELEADSGERLLLACGALMLGAPAAEDGAGGADFLETTCRAAERFAIPHERLAPGEVMHRWPQFRLAGDETGYYEPGAGLVFPEHCIAAQLAAAERRGARVVTGWAVRRIEPEGSGLRVTTDDESWTAAGVVVAAGAWLPGLVGGPVAPLVEVRRQVLHWFPPAEPESWAPGRSPVFLWRHGPDREDFCYGFPLLPGAAGVKLATEQLAATTDPDRVERTVPAAESARFHHRHVAPRLTGLGPAATRAETCLYTVSRDGHFILDRHPDHGRMILVSACSGHGFKHSAAIGEAAAELALGLEPGLDVAAFRLARFG